MIDEGQPMTAPYVICAGNGCMADYEASAELVTNMKKGKGLAVQGVNGAGQVISLQLPLGPETNYALRLLDCPAQLSTMSSPGPSTMRRIKR